MPAPYKKVQFIAFNIRPGMKNPNEYLGLDDSAQDMKFRCDVMKEAIRTAWRHDNSRQLKMQYTNVARGVSNAVDSASVLKVFMAPEFYFRGAEGAYPLDVFSEIIPEMSKETDQKKYEDWLFVFGTAIGYLQRDEATTRVTDVRKDLGRTVITVDSLPEGEWKGAMVKEYAQGRVTGFVHTSNHQFEITLNGTRQVQKGSGAPAKLGSNVHLIQPGSNVYFYRPGSEKTRPLQVLSTKPSSKPDTICITVSDPPIVPCPTCQTSRACTKHEPHPLRPRFCVTCSHSHIQVPIEAGWGAEAEVAKGGTIKVTGVKDLNNGKFELTLNTNRDFTKDCSVTLNRIVSSSKETELFNIALVRRGAPISARPGLKEALIYKEFASQLDFSYTNNTQRVVRIHKKERKMVLTEGSTDPRGRNPNIVGQTRTWTHYKTGQAKQYEISEINKSGIGGGGVITMEGITFGIEVCLDHGTHRLAKFYGGAAVECSDSTCGARVDLGDDCPACGEVHSNTFDPLYLEDGVITCKVCGDISRAGDTCGFCNAATLESVVMAKPGDPRVQIHLIPSWGMDIGLGAGCCVDDGLAFNVDGDRAAQGTASVVRKFDGTWGCDRHLDVAEAAYGDCTESTGQWYCPSCYGATGNPNFGPANSACNLHPPSAVNRVEVTCGASLIQMGTSIAPEAKAAVDMSVLQPDRATFFTTDGQVWIYPPQDIPPAETV